MKTYGRKVAFGVFSELVTLWALWLCLRYPGPGTVLFTPFAAFAAGVVTAVVIGNVGEHFSKKGQP